MSNRIITISREFGSAGRVIGKGVADKLGIPCYDEELIKMIAKESGLADSYIKERGEYMASAGWLSSMFTERDYQGQSMQDYLWEVQAKIIIELADKGPCVIVGRCADYILKDMADLLTVFIHASIEKRAERIISVYGETEEAPKKRLLDRDKRRKSYYQLYTDMEWGVAQNYTLSLDSGELGIEKCIDIICDLY